VAAFGDRAEVFAEQGFILLYSEFVLGREVAEIEETVAYLVVFPVEDADGAAIVDEVSVE
jgi:hypothetical protein